MSPSPAQTQPYSHRPSKLPRPIRNDSSRNLYAAAPRTEMNNFTRRPTAPLPSTKVAPEPTTSRTPWSILPLTAKAATFPSIFPRSNLSVSSPSAKSSGHSSTTTLVNQGIEELELSLAEEWAMAPQWRRDAAKKRVRAMRIWLGIIRRGDDGYGEEEEGIELDELEGEGERQGEGGDVGARERGVVG